MRILLTRNPIHNMLMRREIEKLDITDSLHVFEAPLLEQVPIEESLESLVSFLHNRVVDDVIFISPSAVQFGFIKLLRLLELRRVFAVGRGTANMLHIELGKASKDIPVIYPQKHVGAQALLNLFELQQVKGREILIVTGIEGKPLLEKVLLERSARVSRWECYQRQKPSGLPKQMQQVRSLGCDYVFLHSAHAVKHFLEELPENMQTKSIKAIVGSEAIAQELRLTQWDGEILIAASPMPKDMLRYLKSSM